MGNLLPSRVTVSQVLHSIHLAGRAAVDEVQLQLQGMELYKLIHSLGKVRTRPHPHRQFDRGKYRTKKKSLYLNTTPQKVERSRMHGTIPPLPNTPSWHGARSKHRDMFIFYPMYLLSRHLPLSMSSNEMFLLLSSCSLLFKLLNFIFLRRLDLIVMSCGASL
jgi:hypothetical protein